MGGPCKAGGSCRAACRAGKEHAPPRQRTLGGVLHGWLPISTALPLRLAIPNPPSHRMALQPSSPVTMQGGETTMPMNASTWGCLSPASSSASLRHACSSGAVSAGPPCPSSACLAPSSSFSAKVVPWWDTIHTCGADHIGQHRARGWRGGALRSAAARGISLEIARAWEG